MTLLRSPLPIDAIPRLLMDTCRFRSDLLGRVTLDFSVEMALSHQVGLILIGVFAGSSLLKKLTRSRPCRKAKSRPGFMRCKSGNARWGTTQEPIAYAKKNGTPKDCVIEHELGEFISPELIGRIASGTKDLSFSKEAIWEREEFKTIFLWEEEYIETV